MRFETLKTLFEERYNLVLTQEIARGGSSVVYAIEHKEKQVLKVIDMEDLVSNWGEDMREDVQYLCLNELSINENLSKTRSDYLVNMIAPYMIELKDENIFLCAMRMPYYDTLRSFHEKEKMSEELVIRLGMHMCEALKILQFDATNVYYRNEIDRMGVMFHMDLKPANIFVENKDGNITFKLGDFGTTVDRRDQMVLGSTEGYNAPETDEEDAVPTQQSDIFSLGMVLYYALCGVNDESSELVKKFHEARCHGEEGTKPGNCSPQLWSVIQKATQPECQKRYQNAGEMLVALQEIGNQKTEVAVQKKENAQGAAAVLGGLALLEGIFIAVDKIKEKKSSKTKLVDDKTGDYYEGALQEGIPHGKGSYCYHSGMKKKKMTGNWSFVREYEVIVRGKDATYQGMMLDGICNGYCRVDIPDVGVFQGTVVNGKFWNGTYFYQDESEVSVRNGKPEIRVS